MRYRGAQQHFPVTLVGHGVTGHCGDAADQRLAVVHRAVNSRCGTNVLTDDAELGRNATGRDFLAGQNLDQLLFTARGVLGRNGHHIDVMFFVQAFRSAVQCGNGFRLVVFHANHAAFGIQQVHQHLGTTKDFFGALTHQHVVGGNVWLALGTVKNQGVDWRIAIVIALDGQFDGRREACAAHAGDATTANTINHLGRINIGEVVHAKLG